MNLKDEIENTKIPDGMLRMYESEELFEKYINRKIAKHKWNKDNKPFTKRELHLMKVSFKAGYEWNKYNVRKGIKE